MRTIRLADKPERRTIAIDGLDGCTITVREPTLRERLEQFVWASSQVPGAASGDANHEAAWRAALWEYRLRVVVDWSGFVGDNGEPLQFNPRAFHAAMAQVYPLQAASIKGVDEAFEGLAEHDEKNSDAPSAA